MSVHAYSISVIVCTRDRPVELRRCLEALQQLHPPADEIVVVNSAGLPAAGEIAARYGARYALAETPGVSRARNVGAAAAKGDLVAYLDDDAVANADWLARLSAPFADSRVMVTTGRVEPLDDGNTEVNNLVIHYQVTGPESVDRDTPDWFWLANSGRLGIGTSMMFRRSAFESWPGFDVRLGRGSPIGGGEEHLAFFQLIAAGYRCVHVNDAVVRHPMSLSEDRLRDFERRLRENTMAYLTLLFVEYPQYRLELVRSVARRLLRGGRNGGAPGVHSQRSSPFGYLRVAWRGMRLYWKARSTI